MNQPSSYPTGAQPGASKPVNQFTPWVTYSLLAVTCVAFAVQYFSPLPNGGDVLMLYGAKINEAILAGEWWRLVTPMFLHASLLHILFNMYFLYVVGPSLERFYGRTRYTLLYFLSGVAGNVSSFYLTTAVSVGASTALFGLLSANAVFVYRNRQFFGERAGSMLRNSIMIMLANLAFGLMPGIDIWGHVGGLLGGLAFSWASGPLLQVDPLPGGGYRVVDENSSQRFWWVAVFETAVLLGLVSLRMFGGS
jgi:rhomboid protease GluP